VTVNGCASAEGAYLHTAPAQHREHVVICEADSRNRPRGIVGASNGGRGRRKSEGLDFTVGGGQMGEDSEGDAGDMQRVGPPVMMSGHGLNSRQG
jgi:hypothetical protein